MYVCSLSAFVEIFHSSLKQPCLSTCKEMHTHTHVHGLLYMYVCCKCICLLPFIWFVASVAHLCVPYSMALINTVAYWTYKSPYTKMCLCVFVCVCKHI